MLRVTELIRQHAVLPYSFLPMPEAPKPWKSIDEQMDLLGRRGMSFHDGELARNFLERVGYYRLSGYFYPFRKTDDRGSRTDDFLEGSRFEDVVAMYVFDRKLRLLTMDAIERIELAVQVDIAYQLGRSDPFAHHNPALVHRNALRKYRRRNGRPTSRYQEWITRYEELVSRSGKEACVRHNLEKYGRLPIWAAIQIWDFGSMSKFFAMMRHQDQGVIAGKYGIEAKHLQSWLRSLNFIRNVTAHHGRLWNCAIIERAKLPRNPVELRALDGSRPFLYFCLMKHLLDVISPGASWGERFIAHVDSFPAPANAAVSLRDMGVPEKTVWKQWPLWA